MLRGVLPVGLRPRLMLFIAGTVLGSLALLFANAIQQRRDAVRTAVEDAALLSRLAAAQQERVIAGARQELRRRVAREDGRAVPAASEFPNGAVRALATATPAGRIVASTDPREVGTDVSRTDWFRRAVARRRFAVGDPGEGRDDRATTLRCAEPVLRADGSVRQFVIATIDVPLPGTTSLAHVDEHAIFLLVDRHGSVHASDMPGGRRDSALVLHPSVTASEWQQQVRGGDGRWRVVAFTPVGNGATEGLYVGVGIDRDAVAQRAGRALEISIVMMALFGLLVALVAWRAASLIVLRRVDAMLAMTARLRAGDLNARTGLPYGQGELSDLSHALDSMAARLAQERTERERDELRVRTSEARLRAVLDASVDGILVLDRTARIVGCNGAGRRLLGCTGGGGHGCTGCPLLGASIEESLRLSLPATDEPVTLESELVRTDGSRMPIEIVIAAVRPPGAEEFYVATLRDITDRKRWQNDLEALSHTDELTGLHNRRGFQALAGQQLRLLERSGDSAALVSIDIDGLKEINDTFGHAEGDSALREMADLLRRSFRETDVIARIGGDEFVVLVSSTGGPGVKRALARLERGLKARSGAADRAWKLGASIGWVCAMPDGQANLAEMLTAADRKMYRRKRARGTTRVPVAARPGGPRVA